MYRSLKKVLILILVFLLLVSNIITFLCEQKAYAAIETVILVGGEEVISAVIGTLAGASVSSDLTDEQKLALYDQNKISYYETLQFIVEHPDITADLLEADQKERFLSACATLNHTASTVDEMNKYVHGSVAEKMEDFRDQFSVYSNNENPNDDDNKFKDILKRAAALGGALGIAAGSILSVVYGVNVDGKKEDNCYKITGGDGQYIACGYQFDSTGKKTVDVENVYSIKNSNSNVINLYPVVFCSSVNETSGAETNIFSLLRYNVGQDKYFYDTCINQSGLNVSGTSINTISGIKKTNVNGFTLFKITSCNFPRFASETSYKKYLSDLNNGMELELANELHSINYDDGTIKIPDNLNDIEKADAQKWADTKNLIDLNPDKEGDVRGFIGIYADSVADLSKQGQAKEPSADDIAEAAKRAIEKRLEPDYEPNIEPEPTPQPTPAPEPTPQPTTQPEPTPQPTTQPEPTPQPTTQPEPTPQPTVTPIPTPTPEPNEQEEHLGGVVGDVFPFCIPFDLIYLVKSLKAEPVPPKWVIPFKYERLGIDEEIVIDFAQFEPIAKVCRVCFTILFILMLIMASRKLIKG